MDVNGVGQSIANYNNYQNASVSEYVGNNVDTPIQQIQKVETQSQDVNNGEQQYKKADLDDALKKINNFLKDEHTHAEYSYHKEMKTMMIKIIDENTKEVILEIPPKKILDMVASMCKQVGLIDRKA